MGLCGCRGCYYASLHLQVLFAELKFYNQGIPVLQSHTKSWKNAQETA
jgi:hypothetical protein